MAYIMHYSEYVYEKENIYYSVLTCYFACHISTSRRTRKWKNANCICDIIDLFTWRYIVLHHKEKSGWKKIKILKFL